jgi:hypothetical protein
LVYTNILSSALFGKWTAHTAVSLNDRMTLETDRLLLAAPRLADPETLLAFLGYPEAMRHTFQLKPLKEVPSAHCWP